MKEYLLFDLDGTLTDPKVGITSSVQYALQAFGIEEPDLDKLEPFIGPPLWDSFRDFYHMDEQQAQVAVEKYRERFSTIGLYENEIYSGIPQMLKILQQKGLHMAIASSKPTVFVEKILEHFHIRQYFEVVVGSELDGTRVKKEEVVEEALHQLFPGGTIKKDKVYMIGDRKFDVEGAKALHIDSIGVAYGYGGIEELKAAHADYIVRTVEELKRLLLRGYEDGRPHPTGFQKVWPILYHFLLFQLVRYFANYVLYGILFSCRDQLPEFLVLRDASGVASGYTGNTSVMVSALGFVAGALVIAKTATFVIRKTAEDMYLTHLKEEPKSNYVLAGLLTAGSVVGLNLLFHLTGFTNLSQTYQAVEESQYAASLPVGLFCFGVVSAFAEEFLFRGVLYNYLRRYFSVKIALIASAFLFSAYHGNTVQGVYAFLMGVLLAYSYEYFGDFKVPVLLHMLANILAYILTYYLAAVPIFTSWPVCIFGIGLAVVSAYLLIRQKNVL